MKRVRETVRDRADGWREVTVRCPCARVGRLVALWEDVADVLAELRERHRAEAPACPHRPRQGAMR